jgi:capsular exopolysaccharide synthesis family protein
MSSIPKAVSGRTPFLERIEAGGEGEVRVDDRLVALTDPYGPAAEQYRMLLHRLRHARSLRDNIAGGVVVAVTSTVRGEGVSITAANLALTAARAGGSRVALVDCDLRRGSASQLFGMGARAGLSEVLSGKSEIGEALGNFHEGHLAIIPAGKPPAESAALLASPRFVQTLQLLRSLFDEIYLDVPPALATADAAVVAHKADGVVMVVRAESTPREQVASAIRTLAGAPMWGMVLNGVEPSRIPPALPVVKGHLGSGK